jgi:hypothetical protein
MSKYYVDKFLYQVDRDSERLAQYKTDPSAAVDRWERELGVMLGARDTVEKTTWLTLTDEERAALVAHDYVTLFEMGAHYFLSLTIFIALYDDDYAARSGPLSFQREYAAKLSHWLGKPYPSVEP